MCLKLWTRFKKRTIARERDEQGSIPTNSRWVIEILQQIYHHLDDGYNVTTKIAMLCTCRRWHETLFPLLWTDIVLNNQNILMFANSTNPSYLSCVKSLTIAVNQNQLFRPHVSQETRTKVRTSFSTQFDEDGIFRKRGLHKLHRALRQTSTTLPHMTSLETFSFNAATEYPYGHFKDFWIDPRLVGNILDSLPDTVKNLEIDLCGYDRNPTPSQHSQTFLDNLCLCRQIANIATHLTSLRVHLSHLCSRIFAPSSTLKRLTISLANERLTRSSRCNDGTISYDLGPVIWSAEAWRYVWFTTLYFLTHATRMTGKRGHHNSYPKLEHFEIIDIRVDQERLKFPSLIKHNILKLTTTTSQFNVPRSIKPLPPLQRDYWVRTILDPDINSFYVLTGTVNGILHLHEEQSWIETSSGSRFPMSYRATPKGRQASWRQASARIQKAQVGAKEASMWVQSPKSQYRGYCAIPYRQSLGDVKEYMSRGHLKRMGFPKVVDYELHEPDFTPWLFDLGGCWRWLTIDLNQSAK